MSAIKNLENERAEKFIEDVKAGKYSDPVLEMYNTSMARVDDAATLHYLYIGYTPQNPIRRREFWCKATVEDVLQAMKENGLNITGF